MTTVKKTPQEIALIIKWKNELKKFLVLSGLVFIALRVSAISAMNFGSQSTVLLPALDSSFDTNPALLREWSERQKSKLFIGGGLEAEQWYYSDDYPGINPSSQSFKTPLIMGYNIFEKTTIGTKLSYNYFHFSDPRPQPNKYDPEIEFQATKIAVDYFLGLSQTLAGVNIGIGGIIHSSSYYRRYFDENGHIIKIEDEVENPSSSLSGNPVLGVQYTWQFIPLTMAFSFVPYSNLEDFPSIIKNNIGVGYTLGHDIFIGFETEINYYYPSWYLEDLNLIIQKKWDDFTINASAKGNFLFSFSALAIGADIPIGDGVLSGFGSFSFDNYSDLVSVGGFFTWNISGLSYEENK